MYSIDHVVLAVADLDEAGERLRREHGLASFPGGVHADWGTGNRIVPMGDDYLELISVVDPDVGRTTVLGRALLGLTADGADRWFAVCLADTDLDATAERLRLRIEQGSRVRPDGAELRWRGAGLTEAAREPWFPFFIAWNVQPGLHPGSATVSHDVAVTGIANVELEGDASRLRGWLGPDGDVLPLTVVEGDRGMRAVTLSTAEGTSLRLAAG
jgi:hypothetical protein